MDGLLGGKYRLGEIAGRGGMATVHRAETVGADGFRRPVAVKRILESLSDDPKFVEMFVEEARVVSLLSHPSIVQIHDFDKDEDGAYYLVMEWVDGVNLLEWVVGYGRDGEPTPWPLVTAIIIEVLKALAAAHELGMAEGRARPVYHRDITPQNILLDRAGYVKLTDFGLAKAADRARITDPDVVKGKVSYLAPELVEGHAPSPQSDVFGVGIAMFEALMARKLFEGPTAIDVLNAVRAAEIPDIAAMRRDLPPDLVQALQLALSRSPEARYPSARRFARALSNVLRKTPQSTDADVLGRSVRHAMRKLGRISQTAGL